MSYEKEVKAQLMGGKEISGKQSFSILKYFWQSNPLIDRGRGAIPYFLRKVDILKDLSEFDLYVLSNYLHLRAFEEKELIFEQGDRGVGFYFVLNGEVAIIAQDEMNQNNPNKTNKESTPLGDDYRLVVTLRHHDHFGELALLQEDHIRNAWAVALTPCLLLGFFHPDMEDLIQRDPTVGAKFLRSLGALLANRLGSVTQELATVKRQTVELQNYGKTI